MEWFVSAPDNPHPGQVRSPGDRCRVLLLMGQIGGSEAITFLSAFHTDDLEAKSCLAAALMDAQVGQMQDEQAQIEFIKNVAASHWGVPGSWAVDQLCERGISRYLPVVEASIHRWWSNQYGDYQIRLCEAKMNVINSDANPLIAISKLLDTADETKDTPAGWDLLLWAIEYLGRVYTSEADEVLARYEALFESYDRRMGRRIPDLGSAIHSIRRARSNPENAPPE